MKNNVKLLLLTTFLVPFSLNSMNLLPDPKDLPTGTPDGLACFDKGIKFELAKDMENAEMFYKFSAAQGKSRALTRLADLYEQQGKTKLQKVCYEEMAKKGDVHAEFSLAELYRKEGDLEQAKIHAEIAASKDNWDALLNLGTSYDKKKNYKMALECYERVADKGTSFMKEMAWHNLGLLHEKRGNIKKAKHYYNLLVGVKRWEGGLYLGWIYEGEGNVQEAEKYYKLATKAKYYPDGLFNLACFYIKQGQNRKAALTLKKISLENLKKIKKQYAKSSMPIQHYNLGLLYEREDNLDAALKYFTLASEKGFAGAAYRLGTIYKKQKKTGQALIFMEKAAAQNYKDAQAQVKELGAQQNNPSLVKKFLVVGSVAAVVGLVAYAYKSKMKVQAKSIRQTVFGVLPNEKRNKK